MPQQEVKDPNTLNLIGMVNIEELPWCFPCQEMHLEDECPRRTKEENSGLANSMNFIDTIFSFQDEEFVDITQEQLEEVRKRGARSQG